MILIISAYLIVSSQIVKAYDARRKANLDLLRLNLEIYYSFAEEYPMKIPDCGQPLVYKTQTILDSIPCDPQTRQDYYYQTKGGNPQSYRLYTHLKNIQDISIANLGCTGGCGPDCSFNYGVSSYNIGLTKCTFVCAPGGGKTGSCELYQDSSLSLCPKLYFKDSTCNGECNISSNRCKNASGKNIPY